MPIAEFPGSRNWGYDGVSLFAAHSLYGGPRGFERLVRACHERGLAVILDVVYNHLGPEGNYLREFGPYFTDRYRTPWGEAINFDGPASDGVRRFFLENAIYWLRDCGVDALRLDAVHAIYDRSARPFLEDLASTVRSLSRESGRNIYLIAESDLNDARLIRSAQQGGMGIDAQWSDDLHHCLHALLTGERAGYYADFGRFDQLVTALRQGWTYSGEYAPTRERSFGNSPAGLPPERFVVCSQNHDQVGNRMLGERLSHLVDTNKAKLAAATYLLAPFTPMIFMGEEYAEPAPFLYHVSHSDQQLQEAVRMGRLAEFCHFLESGEPPDPQDECTFLKSKLDQELVSQGRHLAMHRYYAELIRLRRRHPAFRPTEPGSWKVESYEEHRVAELEASDGDCHVRVLLNYGDEPFPIPPKAGTIALDSYEGNPRIGYVNPYSCVVLTDCRQWEEGSDGERDLEDR